MLNQSRTERVLAALQKENITQMLITDPLSIFYLTGVYTNPFERFYALLLRRDGRHIFFLNQLFHVPEDVGIEKIWYTDTDDVCSVVAPRLDPTAVLGVDKDIKARFLLPLMDCRAAAGFVNASLAVDFTRGIKDAEETQRMRKASEINDAAMLRFPTLLRSGITESEVASQMLAVYLSLGADDYAFSPLVAFGANAADPHHSPDDTVLREGDCVLFDVGCRKDSYCSDMTRTFYWKKVNELDRKIYDITRRANEAATALIRPGVPLCELDQTARDIITQAGYGENFTHRLGHFIGMSEHEYGDISSANSRAAMPGMIFSVEPGIYLPGVTGVRLENLVLVTEDGYELLNHAPLDLKVIE